MTDRPVNLGCVVAYALWSLSASALLAAWMNECVMLAALACVLSGGAATATIRTYFVYSNRMIRNAFELGRDAGSGGGGPVQRLR